MKKSTRKPKFEYRRKPKRYGPSNMFFDSLEEAETAMREDKSGTAVGIFRDGVAVEKAKAVGVAAKSEPKAKSE
jgi:hypothetical protein